MKLILKRKNSKNERAIFIVHIPEDTNRYKPISWISIREYSKLLLEIEDPKKQKMLIDYIELFNMPNLMIKYNLFKRNESKKISLKEFVIKAGDEIVNNFNLKIEKEEE